MESMYRGARHIEEADISMTDGRFLAEKARIANRKKKFVFVKAYESFDLYRHKAARLLRNFS